jgi:hypothetical protein
MHICVFSVKLGRFSRLFQTFSEFTLQKLLINIHKYYGGHFWIYTLQKYKNTLSVIIPALEACFPFSIVIFQRDVRYFR